MIWESHYWKKDVLKLSKKIKARSKQSRWPDSANANAEKEIMLAAFMARKLFDSGKISPAIQDQKIKIVKFNSNGNKIHLLRRLSPENYFDWTQSISAEITVRFLCNQIIHSYIFTLIMNRKNHLSSFWVASDYDKFKFMYQVDIKTYCTLLNKIGNYWPKSESYHFDPAKNDYIVTFDT